MPARGFSAVRLYLSRDGTAMGVPGADAVSVEYLFSFSSDPAIAMYSAYVELSPWQGMVAAMKASPGSAYSRQAAKRPRDE
jgi:hypothetical protein